MTTKKNGFNSILDDVQTKASKPAENLPETGLNYKIPGALKKMLDRAVYHKGPQMNQRKLLVQMLEKSLAADPDAHKPVPGE